MKINRILAASLTTVIVGSSLHAQALLDGDLLISRSTYGGVASSVTVGAALPGGGVAVANGSSLSIFNNETPDPSFGITSAILIDQYNTGTNTIANTINVTQQLASQGVNLTTSFPSKSELALNVSTDGTAVTFMGYIAPVNTLDVSNSNTPGNVDSTNPVSTVFQRGVAQLNLSSGTLAVTATNAYSGNNGRAAVLANGNYYMVGNAGNSGSAASLKNSTLTSGSTTVTLASTNSIVAGEAVSGTGIPTGDTVQSVVDATHIILSNAATSSSSAATLTIGTAPSGTVLSNLSNDTGVQTIAAGSSSATTTVVGQAIGTFGSTTGYQNGYSNAPTDKTGKDDNFRGMTVFGNTLFVTKGSGSNGVNTVYQVGATGSLNSLATNASTTAITILSGFNTVVAKTATNGPNPFGLFFANAHTLYVADEGTGVVTSGVMSVSAFAGLGKWVNSKLDGTGTWTLAYTLTKGLNLGQTYTVTDGAGGSVTTMTAGLRNLAGRVNADGTVTLYSVTATAGTSITDAGADPNALVAITDTVENATDVSATEGFTTLETAALGDVLRGVAINPLAASAIPEPATYAGFAGLAVLGLAFYRRRNAR